LISADSALEQLRVGNLRFTRQQDSSPADGLPVFRNLSQGQQPFAAILGCADSRVPPELVFDHGFGELFTVRVAGNVAGPTQVGSLEYAVGVLGVAVVVVLGHTECGAVSATLDAMRDPATERTEGLQAIVDSIQPSIAPSTLSLDSAQGLGGAVRANIHGTVEALPRLSPLLHQRLAEGELQIVGAEYSLESGAVEFLSEEA